MGDFIPIVQSGSISTMTTYRTPISSLSGLFSTSGSALSASWSSASISASYALTSSYAVTSSYSISSSFATSATSASWVPLQAMPTSVASALWASSSLTSISSSWASSSISASWAPSSLTSISSSWASASISSSHSLISNISISSSWASSSISASYAVTSSYSNQAATASYLFNTVPSNGIAKAFVFFTQAGSTLTILNSFNISNVIRIAGGLYTITFTTPMLTTNYLVIGSAIAVPRVDGGVFGGHVGGNVNVAEYNYYEKTISQVVISAFTCNSLGEGDSVEIQKCSVVIY